MWPPIRHFLQTMSLRHAHTVAVKPRTPKSYETPEAKDASRQLGIDAGNFIKTGTTQELARIKSRATRLIEDDQFNIEAFQEGHKQAFGRPYDFDFDNGDIFNIGISLDNAAAMRAVRAHVVQKHEQHL